MRKAMLVLFGIVCTYSLAAAQKAPQFYGVYALQNGQFVKLNGNPLSGLQGPLGISGIIQNAPQQTFPDGSLNLVFYRRDMSIAAPESVFVSIVAKIAREKQVGMNGIVTSQTPLSGYWQVRSRGYKFLVGPYGDNKEMILIRHEDPTFKLPDGRYAISFGDQYYDFLIGKESSDHEHCVEWVATTFGAQFPECPPSPIGDAPEAAGPLTTQQEKMKRCSAQWLEHKKTAGVSGRAEHNKFISTCLKG